MGQRGGSESRGAQQIHFSSHVGASEAPTGPLELSVFSCVPIILYVAFLTVDLVEPSHLEHKPTWLYRSPSPSLLRDPLSLSQCHHLCSVPLTHRRIFDTCHLCCPFPLLGTLFPVVHLASATLPWSLFSLTVCPTSPLAC